MSILRQPFDGIGEVELELLSKAKYKLTEDSVVGRSFSWREDDSTFPA